MRRFINYLVPSPSIINILNPYHNPLVHHRKHAPDEAPQGPYQGLGFVDGRYDQVIAQALVDVDIHGIMPPGVGGWKCHCVHQADSS